MAPPRHCEPTGRRESYGTAHSMCHKIRAALIEPETKLGGTVEVDETFVGGKANNRHWDKRDGKPGPTASGKTIVADAVRRKGNVIARVVDNVRASTLMAFVNEAVSEKVSLLCTDRSMDWLQGPRQDLSARHR
jgi:hypothetical protein